MKIREATRADLSVVRFFHRSLYVDHRAAITPSAAADFYAFNDLEQTLAEDAESLVRRPEVIVLLAENREHGPLGYITGHIELDPRRLLPRKGVVEDWFVLGAARRSGVGRSLFDALIGRFRDAGCDLVESATWPFNEGSRRAHESLGFVEVQIRYRRRL